MVPSTSMYLIQMEIVIGKHMMYFWMYAMMMKITFIDFISRCTCIQIFFLNDTSLSILIIIHILTL